MDGSLSEAMEASAGALPALAAQLQLLSRHAGLVLAIFVGILFLLVVLSELCADQEEAMGREGARVAGGSGWAEQAQHRLAASSGGAASEAGERPSLSARRESG
jgi:hypothetical protein